MYTTEKLACKGGERDVRGVDNRETGRNGSSDKIMIGSSTRERKISGPHCASSRIGSPNEFSIVRGSCVMCARHKPKV